MGKHAFGIASADRSLVILTALCYISQVWRMDNSLQTSLQFQRVFFLL
jgi:hypothetical protein